MRTGLAEPGAESSLNLSDDQCSKWQVLLSAFRRILYNQIPKRRRIHLFHPKLLHDINSKTIINKKFQLLTSH